MQHMRRMTARGVRAFTMAACALWLAGCAALPDKAAEETVRERAQARWDAVIAGKWEQAYGYATPAYREANELYHFRRRLDRGLIKYKQATVGDVTCKETDVCVVKMNMTIFPSQEIPTGNITTTIEERWMRVNGEWWRFEKQ